MSDTQEFLDGWLQSDASSRDSINLKRVYIDMTGSLIDAVMLAQIIYWHTPTDKGKPRLTITHDGHQWLAKRYDAWQEECRVNENTARDSIRRLEELGLIVKALYHFQGSPTVHIRLNPDGFTVLLQAVRDGTIEAVRDDLAKKAKAAAKPKKRRRRPLSDGKPQLAEGGSNRREPAIGNDGSQQLETMGAIDSYTETTAETTAETTESLTDSQDSDSPAPAVASDACLSDDDAASAQPDAVTPDELATPFKLLVPHLEAVGLELLLARGLVNGHGAERVLAVLLHAKASDARNPAGLALTMLEKGTPAKPDFQERAQTILDVGSNDREAIDRVVRHRAYGAHTARMPAAAPTGNGNGAKQPSPAPTAANGLDTVVGFLKVREHWRYACDQAKTFAPATFASHVAHLVPVRYADGVLEVSAPTDSARDYVHTHLVEQLVTDLNELAPERIRLQVSGPQAAAVVEV